MNSYLLPKKCYSNSCSYSFFIIAVLFFFVAATADAYDVVLAWDPNTEFDIAGYKLYGSEGSHGSPYDLIDTYSLDDIDPDNPAVSPPSVWRIDPV